MSLQILHHYWIAIILSGIWILFGFFPQRSRSQSQDLECYSCGYIVKDNSIVVEKGDNFGGDLSHVPLSEDCLNPVLSNASIDTKQKCWNCQTEIGTSTINGSDYKVLVRECGSDDPSGHFPPIPWNACEDTERSTSIRRAENSNSNSTLSLIMEQLARGLGNDEKSGFSWTTKLHTCYCNTSTLCNNETLDYLKPNETTPSPSNSSNIPTSDSNNSKMLNAFFEIVVTFSALAWVSYFIPLLQN